MASEESRLGGSNTKAKLGRQLFTQLALSEIHAKKYWVEIETVEQTPDTKVHHIDQSRGHNVVQTQSVEVVDWEQHVEDPMALIRAKSRKSYPDHFCLLITARSGKTVYPQVIARDIRPVTVPFAEIWILALSAYNTVSIARLHPTVLQFQFDIPEALKRATTDVDVFIRQPIELR